VPGIGKELGIVPNDTESAMDTVQSRDGTRIAFEQIGDGPPLVLVDGALCYRESGPMRPLARELASHFSVVAYDRRGRGESADTRPYSTGREVEDLEAIINRVGGAAYVFGISSGAALALEAARQNGAIKRLALYEAPFIVDDTRPPIPSDFLDRLRASVDENRRGDAVKMFMKLVGVPAVFVALMRLMPAWSKLTAIAHTLPYDISLVKDFEQGRPLPAARWQSATMPAWVADGSKSPAWMRNAMRQLADVLPSASYRTLDRQTHMVNPKVLAPALVEFFNDGAYRRSSIATGHRLARVVP
jgi:pimeloyl-ACP methyl ester carboxylesterase